MDELVTLDIQPGLFTEGTARSSVNRWRDGNHVRWPAPGNLPETTGGWEDAGFSSDFRGICRRLEDWVSIAQAKYLALGTNLKLYIGNGTTLSDVTPYRAATNGYGGAASDLTDPFTTVAAGSPNVSVAHTNHGVMVGDSVHFDCTSATFDNVTIDGEYTVLTVTSANAYVIVAGTNASAGSVNGGGTVDYAYEINVGPATATTGTGWGAGTWGTGTWGTARSSSDIRFEPRTWCLPRWGEDLLANPRGGNVIHWDTSSGVGTRATIIANAPDTALGLAVSELDRHAIAFGAHDGSADDPLNIAWCDQEDFNTWSPASTNTAGDIRMDRGSRYVGHVSTRREIVTSTDTAVYRFYYAGLPAVFSLELVGDQCGFCGPNAGADLGGIVAWMGVDNFWIYNGGSLDILPCDIRSFVFGNVSTDEPGINVNQRELVYCSVNSQYTEFRWEFPRGTAGENSHYVAFNWQNRTWSKGEVVRTAMHNTSTFFRKPYGAGTDGNIYVHESGEDANGSELGDFLESWDIALPKTYFSRVKRLIPDFAGISSAVNLTIYRRRYPASQRSTKGPYEITASTTKVGARLRARQFAIRLAGSGGAWRMGPLMVLLRPHGKR